MFNSLKAVLCILVLCSLYGCETTTFSTMTPAESEKLAQINTELAFQYIQQRRYDTALDTLENALRIKPSYPHAHNAMGLLRIQLDQIEEAEASFKRAISLAPEDPATLNNYGQFLCRQKRYDEGDTLFRKAFENPLYMRPAVALSNAGTCSSAKGDLEKAEAYFRLALGEDPYLTAVLLQMAEVSHRKHRFRVAESYLQRYEAVGPRTPESLWLGIQIARALENLDKISSYGLLLEKAFPDSSQTSLYLKSKTPSNP